jgi:23S rRNA pseudouridine1911/1915/1917 synthase
VSELRSFTSYARLWDRAAAAAPPAAHPIIPIVVLNNGWSYREQIGPAGEGRAVLAYLAERRPHSSPGEWAARLARGEVELDGRPATPDGVLRAGQVLVWHRPPWDEPEVPTSFAVLYEDDSLLAVAKPRGLPTMPAGGFLQHTLLALVRSRWPSCRPLHRLGRHTSGVVLFARSSATASVLARAWRGHEVRKWYRTLAAGAPAWDVCEIGAPIGPVPHPRLGTVHAASPDGRAARSIARVLERGQRGTLVEVEIPTGRPHQVRIHLAVAGHPLVGDPLYAAGGGLRPDPGLPGDGGYLLHAERLAFTHPRSGMALCVAAPVPPDLAYHEADTRERS